MNIDKAYIDKFLDVNIVSGKIFPKLNHGRARLGIEMGCTKPGNRSDGGGYRVIRLNKKLYRVHHLVWFVAKGEWPKGQIDHINGDRADNRIENLREVTSTQNKFNSPKQKNNKSGFKWVYWDKQSNKWKVDIRNPKSRKIFYSGYFNNPAIAYAKACEAAKRLHGEFFNGK